MNIVEVSWVARNAHRLTEDERLALDDSDFFQQYANGELHLPIKELTVVIEHCGELYKKYAEGGRQVDMSKVDEFKRLVGELLAEGESAGSLATMIDNIVFDRSISELEEDAEGGRRA